MEELIKELKRDIISGSTYVDLEKESHDINDINYRNEHLLFEDGKIAYYCMDVIKDNTTREGGSVIYDGPETFLKASIKEIIQSINACYCYNVTEVENE